MTVDANDHLAAKDKDSHCRIKQAELEHFAPCLLSLYMDKISHLATLRIE
jgi:hypothetical protein